MTMKSIEETNIELDSSNFGDLISYRDEGNMNLVVSLSSNNQSDEKQVIRFKKVVNDEEQLNSTVTSKDNERTESEIFIRFEESLRKYLENSDHFTVEPRLVYVDVNLNKLNEFLLFYRPVSRRFKVIGSHYGLLCRDVAFLPRDAIFSSRGNFTKISSTFCIEIKTKQGFILDEFNDHETQFDNIQKCRFCYLQYLKLKGDKIEKVSNYCPIDLFSGNTERMNRAICGLLDNPQNNLKILKDGKSVYSEHVTNECALYEILSKIFPDILDHQKKKVLLINLIRGILLKNFKDAKSVVRLSTIPEQQHDIHERNCFMKPRSMPIECSILKSVYQAQQLIYENYSKMGELVEREDRNDNFAKKVLKDWSAGSTALDCSVMLSFCRINTSPSENFESLYHLKLTENSQCSQDYLVNATIVDLDFKKDSIAHFQKYKRQLYESKMAFVDFMNTKKSNTND